MLNPPVTGNADLDSFLYNIQLGGIDSVAAGIPAGFIVDDITGTIKDGEGNIIGYLYQYIHIKYADDNVGTNLTDIPTNKLYYGIHNSKVSTESTNPADYTWFLVDGGGFGVSRNLYYQVRGGRQISFDVATAPKDYRWKIDPGTAIDIDIVVPPLTISFNEILNGAVTELKLANDAVTAAKLNVAAIDGITGNLVNNSVGTTQITDNAITSQKITANAVIAGKIAANAVTASTIEASAVTAEKIAANAVTAEKITAGAVTAIKILAGTITADRIEANSIAVTQTVTIQGNVTTIATFPNAITFATSNSVGGIFINNTSNVSQRMLLTGTGRSGVTAGNSAGEFQTFGVFDGTTKLFDYGWSPAGEDSKSFGVVITVPANSFKSIDVRAAKTSNNVSLSYTMTLSTLGVRN